MILRPSYRGERRQGHLAHYSVYHLAVDASTLICLGWLVERRFGATWWSAILLLGAAAVSGAFLLSEPHLEAYRGLSGIDCAAFAAALMAEGRRRPFVALAVGLALGSKLVYEQVSAAFLFPATGWGDMGEPVLSAHTVGAGAGMVVGLAWLLRVFLGRAVRPGCSPSLKDSAGLDEGATGTDRALTTEGASP